MGSPSGSEDMAFWSERLECSRGVLRLKLTKVVFDFGSQLPVSREDVLEMLLVVLQQL